MSEQERPAPTPEEIAAAAARLTAALARVTAMYLVRTAGEQAEQLEEAAA